MELDEYGIITSAAVDAIQDPIEREKIRSIANMQRSALGLDVAETVAPRAEVAVSELPPIQQQVLPSKEQLNNQLASGQIDQDSYNLAVNELERTDLPTAGAVQMPPMSVVSANPTATPTPTADGTDETDTTTTNPIPAAPYKPAGANRPGVSTSTSTVTQRTSMAPEAEQKLNESSDAYLKSLDSEMKAQTKLNEQKAAGLEAAYSVERKQAEQDKAALDADMAKAAEKRAEYDRKISDVANHRFDSGRWFRESNTASKVFSVLGLIAGGLGQAYGQDNTALKVLLGAVDRDIDLQKADLEKKKASADMSRTAYQDFYNATKDKDAAAKAFRVATLDRAIREMEVQQLRAPDVMAAAIEKEKAKFQVQRAKEYADFNKIVSTTETKASSGSGTSAVDQYKQLPVESQKQIDVLAEKTANKINIVNQIDAVVSPDRWNALTNDEKLQQGREMLKTLNSTLGSDAVGQEEVKRLGDKLEHAALNFFNVFSQNPVRLGRDLEGFANDARKSAANHKAAAEANEKEINRLYGRPSKDFKVKDPRAGK